MRYNFYLSSVGDHLPPQGPIGNLVFWIVIGLLILIAADSVLYGLSPKNHLDLPGGFSSSSALAPLRFQEGALNCPGGILRNGIGPQSCLQVRPVGTIHSDKGRIFLLHAAYFR
jgi:hypothetical protein